MFLSAAPDYTLLYYTILYFTILCYAMLYYTLLYFTILGYTIPYHAILYYTILVRLQSLADLADEVPAEVQLAQVLVHTPVADLVIMTMIYIYI